MNDRVAIWPVMLSTRERLTITELTARLFRSGSDTSNILRSHVPITDRSCIPTTCGKAAFELAVRSAGLAGAKIILPAFIPHDFVGIFQKYAITPVFVDVDPDSWQLDPTSINRDILCAADALVLLHTFGLPADGRAFRELCERYRLVLVEDCARALGARSPNGLVGSHGDFAIFSLSKVAPVPHGGMLVSRAPILEKLQRAQSSVSSLANMLLLLKVPGLAAIEGPLYRLVRGTAIYPGEEGLYEPPAVEHPERMVSLVFEAFLPSYSEVLRRKREIGLEIRRRLEPLGFRFQTDPGTHTYAAIGAIVPEGLNRNAMRAFLRSRAVNVYTLWGDPLGISSVAAEAWGTNPGAFPNTSLLASRLLHFPINRFMTSRDVDRLVDACTESTKQGPA